MITRKQITCEMIIPAFEKELNKANKPTKLSGKIFIPYSQVLSESDHLRYEDLFREYCKRNHIEIVTFGNGDKVYFKNK